MKIEELTLEISNESGVEPQAVKKVLEAVFALLAERLGREEKVELQGLGTFVRKQGRKANKRGKTLFKSWSATGPESKKRKAAKGRKKARKQTRKAKSGSSP